MPAARIDICRRRDQIPGGFYPHPHIFDTLPGRKAGAVSCAKIMLIRHAERPSADKSIRGVSQQGVKNKEELTVRGWQRAGALVRFFAPLEDRYVHPALARPDILFACKAGPDAPSLRPRHTLLPLADILHAEFNCDYYEGEEEPLVKEVLAARAGTALIAWKHNNMSVIANAILGDKVSAPQYWPFDRFDLVWVFDKRGGSWTFSQVPQLLLAGDRPCIVS
ncbi:MAG: histidine phosphatase family protein [Beijerinckiaceae bacterium]|nr:histidine phosphatase family protein [Beijerinckiaceae bacterium]MCI0736688.1 histidine phosphatase family protein [Beijerinckiaceae bacterium]